MIIAVSIAVIGGTVFHLFYPEVTIDGSLAGLFVLVGVLVTSLLRVGRRTGGKS